MGSSASSRSQQQNFQQAPVLYVAPYSIPNEYQPAHRPSLSNGRPESTTRWSVPPQPLYTSTNWDETRDLTYSRILSAEEFLTRMLEHDENLRVVSQMPDRDRYSVHITEILGVRGHLNNELLRIQQMLAANDPRMKCIAEFEESNSVVVQKLRELRDESERLKREASSSGSGIDASTEMDFKKAIFGIMGTNTDDLENDGYITLRGRGEMGRDTGQDESMLDESLETEDDLHIKHSQEESRMASRYAQVIAGGRQMSLDEINSLLSIHGKNVHALKMKQEQERKLFRDKLNEKRRQLAGGESSDGGSSSDLNASMDGRSSSARARRREKQTRGGDREKSDLDSTSKSNSDKNNQQYTTVDIDGMLQNHSAVLRGFRSKKEMDRKNFEQILQRKKQQKNGSNCNPFDDDYDDDDDDDEEKITKKQRDSSNTNTSGVENDRNLQSIVQTLETLRLRGELNDGVVARLMSKYYGSGGSGSGGNTSEAATAAQGGHRHSKGTSRYNNNYQNDQESASQLVQETQAKQKQLQSKRQQEKEKVEAKLREKLVTRNQRGFVDTIIID